MPADDRSEALTRHVRGICTQHDIRIMERDRYGGYAHKRSRTIFIRPVKTERTYIVALHEIGHILGKGRSGNRLEGEAAAWEFVMTNSMVQLKPITYARMHRYLHSYVLRAARRRRMVMPPHGHPFWRTYETMRELAGLAPTDDAAPSRPAGD